MFHQINMKNDKKTKICHKTGQRHKTIELSALYTEMLPLYLGLQKNLLSIF